MNKKTEQLREKISEKLESVNIGCSEGGDYRLCNPYCENPDQVADQILKVCKEEGLKWTTVHYPTWNFQQVEEIDID